MHSLLVPLQNYLDKHKIEHFSAEKLTWVNSLHRRCIPPEKLFPNVLPALFFLERLRIQYGPIEVVSGYRDKQANVQVKGSRRSKHMEFRAIDFCPVNKKLLRDCKDYVLSYWRSQLVMSQADLNYMVRHGILPIGGKMGIGAYLWGMHVDFRYRYRKWGEAW